MNTHDPPPDAQPAQDRKPVRNAGASLIAGGPDVVDLLLQIRERVASIEQVVTERQRVRDPYSTAKVAEILGKAEFTVREWCRRGRVQAKKKHSGRGKHPFWVISNVELKRIQRERILPP